MKKNKFLLLLLLLFTVAVIAQQKKYVSYTVKKGETIKSIAKDYNISTRDLLNLNPGVKRKPKAETVIIVPNRNFGKKVVVVPELNTYIVKPKETLFAISRMFGVTIEELKTANPSLKDGLKIDMKLLIPEPSITQLKDSVDYVLHRVVKDDTSYNLTKRFEVSEADLYRLNPALKEGLKLGMLLKIKPIETEDEDLEETANISFKEELDLNKEINVVLMLPYQINKFVDSTRIKYCNGFSLGGWYGY